MLLNAFSENIIKKCELITTITVAQMKSRYRKTFAGFLWVILNPMLTFLVQALIFRHILKLEVNNYFVFLMSGLVPWVFLVSSINMTVSTFIVNRSTLMAFRVEPWIFLISQILDNFVNFLVSYLILIFFVDYTIFLNPWVIPLFVLSTLLIIIFVYFLCFFLATLNVFFRDTQYILQFLTNLAIFITPIFYPITLLPLSYQKLVVFNPFYIMLKPFQSLIWKYDLSLFWQSLLQAFALTVFTIIVTVFFWRKKRNAIFYRI